MAVLIRMISRCVKVMTKLSIQPSNCDEKGIRHAALCQRQSLNRRDATSIPPPVTGLANRTESAAQSHSSGTKLQVSIYTT